jgi:hypothetical protein
LINNAKNLKISDLTAFALVVAVFAIRRVSPAKRREKLKLKY